MKKLMQSSDKSTYLRVERPVWVAGFIPALEASSIFNSLLVDPKNADEDLQSPSAFLL